MTVMSPDATTSLHVRQQPGDKKFPARERHLAFITALPTRHRPAVPDRFPDHDATRGDNMLALQSSSAGIGHEQALIVLFAIIAMIFWRDMIKIAVMIGALLLIILVSFGAVVLLDLLQHVHG
jgi:hypothetical protein